MTWRFTTLTPMVAMGKTSCEQLVFLATIDLQLSNRLTERNLERHLA